MDSLPFGGPIGKLAMIGQGYVPKTCTLPEETAGGLIYAEVLAGRSPCWRCNADRSVCGGQPKGEREILSAEPRCWSLPAYALGSSLRPRDNAPPNYVFARARRRTR